MAVSRRAFLKGRSSKAPSGPRPPWSVANFTDLCSRDADCRKACPQGVLIQGGGGFPVADFSKNGCTFCGECVRVCPTGALGSFETILERKPWELTAFVSDACIEARGVSCRICKDFCEAGALRFRPMTGGRAQLEIDSPLCTGCGACAAPCPVKALSVGRQETPCA